MRMNYRVITISLLLLIFSAAVGSADCLEANPHHEYHVEHDSAVIHCTPPFGAFLAATQTVSKFQSRKASKVPAIIEPKIDRIPLHARIHDHPFQQPRPQQNLFRMKQVLRL